MTEITISIKDLSRNFNGEVQALDDVSLEFKSGTLYGMIGPAGAGKTTTLRIMQNLLFKDSGTIEYFEDDKKVDFQKFRENVAYMPERQSLYADLSISEHLDFFRDLYGISDADYNKKRDELLDMTRLDKFADRPAGKLSGGMYKKLGLMCAMLRSPKVMLLDEPTNGVDPISRREFWEMLHTAVQNNILVIMTTAYMDEAERCGCVYLMEQGKILGSGEPRELLLKEKAANFDELFIKRAKDENHE